MNAAQARSEVQRMLVPFNALKNLEEVLDVAVKLESERAGVTRELAQAKQDLDNTKVANEVADRDYADRQAKIEAGMTALRAQYQAQESSYAEQAAVLRDQLTAAQLEWDETRKSSEAATKAAVAKATKRTADLEREYASRKSALETEYASLDARLQSLKAELGTLLKRVSG